MFQRQRPPYQGGMGFPRGMPTNPFMNQMSGHPPMMRNGRFPQIGAQGQAQMRQGGGGLLSRLLGRGNQAAGLSRGSFNPTGLAAPVGEASGGLLSALSNPSAINGFLTNTQKMLNTASQFGPMIQQYGPLVKNIPAMWKLYRGLKDSSDSSNSNDEVQKTDHQFEKKKTPAAVEKQETNSNDTVPNRKVEKQIGMSKPKLYI